MSITLIMQLEGAVQRCLKVFFEQDIFFVPTSMYDMWDNFEITLLFNGAEQIV